MLQSLLLEPIVCLIQLNPSLLFDLLTMVSFFRSIDHSLDPLINLLSFSKCRLMYAVMPLDLLHLVLRA
jgi:hypothetical protein